MLQHSAEELAPQQALRPYDEQQKHQEFEDGGQRDLSFSQLEQMVSEQPLYPIEELSHRFTS